MRRAKYQRRLRAMVPARRARDVVLMYHRVCEATHDPLALAVRPAHFTEQADVLAALDHPVVPLEELLEPADHPRVAITFDDGYLDNFDVAAPVLTARGLPATYFVTTGALEAGAPEFWWDRLEHLLLDDSPMPPRIELTLGDRTLALDLSSTDARVRSFVACNDAVAVAPPPAQDRLIEALAAALGRPVPAPCAHHARIRPDRLRTYAGDPLVRIGAHTRDHAALRNLDDAGAEAQIVGCRERLGEVLGTPVATMAYPFGGRLAVGPRDVALARRAGYALACSTRPDTHGRHGDRYRIPRWQVPDVDGATFRERLLAFAAV